MGAEEKRKGKAERAGAGSGKRTGIISMAVCMGIGSFMWLKDNGKLRFCRMSLAGTGGQCLMTPPQTEDGTIEQIAKGVRLKDMPGEWFEIPSETAMKNNMTAAVGVFACNRLMDAMELEKAEETIKKLLSMDIGMAGIYRSMLQLDCIYCELVNEKRPEHPEQILDKELEKFMKSMKKFPSILRTQYTYALLGERDAEKAEQIRKTFEKNAKSYPLSRRNRRRKN